jgi:uncharacterized protein (UPF0179 family)
MELEADIKVRGALNRCNINREIVIVVDVDRLNLNLIDTQVFHELRTIKIMGVM